MSSENFLAKGDFGNSQRVKDLTTSSTVTTYTAKTGGDPDFIVDRVIRVTTTENNDMTITLPDGFYYGQKCLVIFEVEGSAETVDITSSTGDNGTQLTAAGGYNRFEWHGSTLGWCLTDSSAT